MEEQKRHDILSRMNLEDRETLDALASAMKEPIRRSLEFTSLRKLLMVHEDPSHYVMNGLENPYILSGERVIPGKRNKHGVISPPSQQISCLSRIDLREVRTPSSQHDPSKSYVWDRVNIDAAKTIKDMEAKNVLQTVQTISDSISIRWDSQNLRDSFLRLEENGHLVLKVVMNPFQYSTMRDWDKFNESTPREMLTSGLYGHFHSADIHVTPLMPAGSLLLSSIPDELGIFHIRKNIEVSIFSRNSEEVTFLFAEEIGIGAYKNGHSLIVRVI